jgi:tetratricopeptide (TPR) repeat protein
MPADQRAPKTPIAIGLTSLALAGLLATPPAAAEIKTITATGEYRMGDNDTRTDAKRLALLDAKRLALEQAGTYLESVTEVKNLKVSRDELNAYTAGIVEVTELDTKDVLDGATHIIRVGVTTKIDTDVVWQQIDGIRKNEEAKSQLLRLQTERDELRKELEAKTRELSATKDKLKVQETVRQRTVVLNRADVNGLLAEAQSLLYKMEFSSDGKLLESKPTKEEQVKARKLIERAITLEPSHPEPHYLLGLLLGMEGDRAGAIREFKEAVALIPKNQERGESWFAVGYYHSSLGRTLLETGDLLGAIAEYREVIRVNPVNDLGYIMLSLVLRKAGDRDAADHVSRQGSIISLRHRLSLAPLDASDRFHLAEALFKEGLLTEAIPELRETLRLDPNHLDAHYFLGLALKKKGDMAGAATEFRACLRITPDNFLISYELAQALEALGNKKAAIKEYRASVQYNPNMAEAHYHLAKLLYEAGDLREAIEEYRAAVELEPAEASYHFEFSHALQKAKNYEGAISELRTYLFLEPDRFLAQYMLAETLYSHGPKEQAREEFRNYLKMVPDTPENQKEIQRARAILKAIGK